MVISFTLQNPEQVCFLTPVIRVFKVGFSFFLRHGPSESENAEFRRFGSGNWTLGDEAVNTDAVHQIQFHSRACLDYCAWAGIAREADILSDMACRLTNRAD